MVFQIYALFRQILMPASSIGGSPDPMHHTRAPTTFWVSGASHPFQDVEPLHAQEMQHVDEDPVFRQLVAVAPIKVHYTHIRRGCRRQTKEAPYRLQSQVCPPEEAAVIALGQPTDVTVELPICEALPEGALVLFDIAVDCVGSADAIRSPPEHILVPAAP